jgi:hypothetical protein
MLMLSSSFRSKFVEHKLTLLKSNLQTHPIWKTEVRGKFVELLIQTWVAQQSVIKITSLKIMNAVTPKVAAKHELFFNKRA